MTEFVSSACSLHAVNGIVGKVLVILEKTSV